MFERVTYLLYTVDLHDVVVTLTCFRDGLPDLRQTMLLRLKILQGWRLQRVF